MELKDKIALITGAGHGFGEAITRAYVERGAKVAVADIRKEAADSVVASLPPGSAIAIGGDVSSKAAIEEMVAATKKAFGVPNIVVNNAGYTHRNMSMLDVDEETYDRVFAVNVKSIYYMTHAVVPAMKENGGGLIINIGSTAGIRPRPGLTWYNASKAAVNLMSKSMAIELAPWKIRVNSICPVLGLTGMFSDFIGGIDTPEIREKFVSTIPAGRFSEPHDVAEAALYLTGSDFITGIELPVDGGRTI